MNNYNWITLSSDITLKKEHIIYFKKYFDMGILTQTHKHKEWFVDEYSDEINWDQITAVMDFDKVDYSYDFYSRYSDKLNWKKLSSWRNIDEFFINMYSDKLDWKILSETQGLTNYIVGKYPEKIIWTQIKYNNYISDNIKKIHGDKINAINMDNTTTTTNMNTNTNGSNSNSSSSLEFDIENFLNTMSNDNIGTNNEIINDTNDPIIEENQENNGDNNNIQNNNNNNNNNIQNNTNNNNNNIQNNNNTNENNMDVDDIKTTETGTQSDSEIIDQIINEIIDI